MSDSLASRVRHLVRCGALPNKAKLEIEGRVTEVSMFDVEKALERAENPKLPKLPKGYWVRENEGRPELWNAAECLVVFDGGVFFFNPFYPKDAPAVIAFLEANCSEAG